MSTPDIERLRSIKTLPSLIAYLRDELNWPIDRDMVEDDLTFEYSAEELGVAPGSAVGIKEIKQLRPMDAKQPWGIFWVNFEKKQLPVVLLRRILGHLVVKKRASANKSTLRSWHANDLLFISAYGEEGDRAITFAHFSQDAASPGDLPILKILGWDGGDTVMHLVDAHRNLTDGLRWPDNPVDVESWRKQWGAAFVLRHREVISTTQELVEELARLATSIRKMADTILARESDRGPMRRLYSAFKTALIHDLSEGDFADVIAQTISYGLLAARFSSQGSISMTTLVRMIPETNPFLRELLGELLVRAGRKKGAFDFDELGIQDVVDLLNCANAEAVKADFGNRTRNEDPVIYFYEVFARQYDPSERIRRGEFYTPQPVASYIVRSVNELLQTEFGLEDGLADTTTWGEMVKKNKVLKIPDGAEAGDPFVLILDPATGTGTFLVEVIEVIFTHLKKKWTDLGKKPVEISRLWNVYVPDNLLPRLYGYELKMAPYVIAHMKLALKLQEINTRLGQPGYQFRFQGRAHIYLTNSLEPPDDKQIKMVGFDALAHEAAAVNEIKRHKRFTVVIGNPPYAGHSRNNEIRWIVDLVKDFTRDEPSLQGPGQGKWLQDDYVKFLRISQHLLEPTQAAVLAMITNHRYLTNRTFRGMRRLWRDQFPLTRILDLHGNRVVHEVSPIGHDENVFDIEQGVAIGIFAKGVAASSSIGFCELWGSRTTAAKKGKYDILATTSVGTTTWAELNPRPPDWLFSPRQETTEDIQSEFDSGIKMIELMPGALGPNGKPQSGLATMHDAFALSFTTTEVEDKIRQFLKTTSRDEAKELFGTLCNPQQWDYATAKRTLASPAWRKKVSRICFSPFDSRYTVYDKSVAVHLRRRLSDNFFNRTNLGLVIGEAGQEISGDDWDAVSCVDSILQLNYFRRNGSPTLPLYLYDDDLLTDGANGRRTNLSAPHLEQIAERLRLKVGKDGMPAGLAPEDIFHYAYAVFYSPTYRTRYAEFLKIDFPRLPLTTSLELFRALAKLGGELVALHLMESPRLDNHITKWIGGKSPDVEKVTYTDETIWTDKAQSEGFRGVPENVWNFHIGGYRVCEKWLKDRKGRTLTEDDIEHYQKVVVALNETIRLMAEIDEVIDAHGGWPGAFK